MDHFDPLHLTPTASLNRVRIFDAPPSERWDEQGRLAYNLLSRDALVADIQRYAHQLGLDPGDPASLPQRFGHSFDATDDQILQAANTIVHRWGERFATLVLVLERGDPRHRAARPEWGDARWKHWAGVEHLWMGGGLCAGPFGVAMAAYAQAYLALRRSHCSLHLAPYPAYLPLIGAARSVPAAQTNALVFDFGSSLVKRAVPHFEGKTLMGLRLMPNVPVTLSIDHDIDARENAPRYLLDVITTTLHEIPAHDQPTGIVLSLAAYVAHNQMLPGQSGLYQDLIYCTPNIAMSLEEHIEERIGRHINVMLLHDGTAAARTFAGEPNTAVIMLGTALGSGFPPPEGSVRPIAPTFSVGAV